MIAQWYSGIINTHSKYYFDLLDVDLHMLPSLLVLNPSSNFFSLYTVFLHKDGGSTFSVTNYMSHFSLFFPIKAIVELANRNTVYSQLFGVALCNFTNCSIIYIVVTVYCCPGQPYNTTSLGSPKFYIGFLKFASEPLEHCDYLPSRSFLDNTLPYSKQFILSLNINLSKSTLKETVILWLQLYVPHQKRIVISLFTTNLVMSQLSDKKMERKVHMKGLPKNLHGSEYL